MSFMDDQWPSKQDGNFIDQSGVNFTKQSMQRQNGHARKGAIQIHQHLRSSFTPGYIHILMQFCHILLWQKLWAQILHFYGAEHLVKSIVDFSGNIERG